VKKMFFAAAIFVAAAAQAAEPAGYEVDGFPITRHQVAVVGALDVREQSPVPALILGHARIAQSGGNSAPAPNRDRGDGSG
jgi:hypothetical protein